MRILILLFMIVLLSAAFYLLWSGNYLKVCPVCDDDNPCTYDYCTNEKECAYKPIDGTSKGCFGEGGCIKYGCVRGECLAQDKKDCCGNSICESLENFNTCPRDCKGSCSDEIQNNGESGIDCGGPCDPCGDNEVDHVKKISSLRDEWYKISNEYNKAVEEYNHDFNLDNIRDKSTDIFSRVSSIKTRFSILDPPDDMVELYNLFSKILDSYLISVDHMVKYSTTQKANHLQSANNHMNEAISYDRLFVNSFNEYIGRYNTIKVNCHNGEHDSGEVLIDCGDICNKSCFKQVIVSKNIIIENSGHSVDVSINITPAAIDYPPYHRVLHTTFDPEPYSSVMDPEGNVAYVYKLRFGGNGIQEVKIKQLVKLTGGLSPARGLFKTTDHDYAIQNSELENQVLCPVANDFRDSSKKPKNTVENIFSWLNRNIVYYSDDIEHGALQTYTTRKGACDEHADLSNSFSRCLKIPSRRVIGYLINYSTIEGHAWSEYYDDGWVFFDPSVKGSGKAFVSDTRHIVSCVGKKALSCGTTYSYSYWKGKKPRLKVEEFVYLE